MSGRTFVRSTSVAAPVDALFDWHARPGAFERLAPPWEDVRVESAAARLAEGERVVLRVPSPPFVTPRWTAEIRDVRRPEGFRDVQVAGPFRRWEHARRMTARGGGSSLEDRVEFELPLGVLGGLAAPAVQGRLRRLFEYRHSVTAADVAQIASLKGTDRMRILVTGASGLVGSALVPFLSAAGHTVLRAVRGTPAAGDVAWDPAAGRLDAAALDGVDAVIHLAGENVAARWTPEVKARIRGSRVDGTSLVARTLAGLTRKPRVLVCASAVGWYGDRGDEILDESSARGTGFLPEVCEAWERAADPARAAGIRVVHLRIGVVLSPKGGALAKMLTPFRLGVGGILGSGRQWMPAVSIDDVLGAVLHVLDRDTVAGPLNVCAPTPATNREFTKALGRVLGRPTIFPMPAFAARLAFGEMAEALLLASTRAVPQRLLASGYRFRHGDAESALRHVLGR